MLCHVKEATKKGEVQVREHQNAEIYIKECYKLHLFAIKEGLSILAYCDIQLMLSFDKYDT